MQFKYSAIVVAALSSLAQVQAKAVFAHVIVGYPNVIVFSQY